MRRAPATIIQELYLKRQPTYTVAGAAQLLAVPEEHVMAAASDGTLALEHNDLDAPVLAWEEVATLALTYWTPRMIEAVLGLQSHDVIPLLNQHRTIRVSLPIYLIRLLHAQAETASAGRDVPRNASDILEQVLLDFASSCHTTTIEVAIPGITQALSYPYFTPRYTGLLSHRCRYCNTAIAEAGRELCRRCKTRHEPEAHLGDYGLPELT